MHYGVIVEIPGGFRLDESPAGFEVRIAAIRKPTRKKRFGTFTEDDLENLIN
jgi:hypothetical protein